MISYIVPILYLIVIPTLYDPSTLLRALMLIIIPSLMVLFSQKKELRLNLPSISIFLLVLIYLISYVKNNQNYAGFLHGTYGRNFGILSLIGLAFTYILGSTSQSKDIRIFIISLKILTFLSMLYAVIQLLGLDPIQWEEYTSFILTLGNINFSGAFLAILSNLFLYQIRKSNRNIKYLNLFFYLLIVLLCLLNSSLQSIIILLINLFVFYLIIYNATLKKITQSTLTNIKKKSVITTLILFTASLIVINTNVNFFTNLSKLGNTDARLRFWITGLKIFEDNWLYGVGIEGTQNYIGQYRQISDVRGEGAFAYSDKLHNVFLDHLVSGGVFAGGIYAVFTFLIFKRILILKKQTLNEEHKQMYFLLSAIWIGYFFQSLISPDHLVLAALGYLSAGFLFSIPISTYPQRNVKKYFKNLVEKIESIRFSTPLKVFATICIFISFITYSKAIKQDIAMKQYVLSGSLSDSNLELILSEWPNPRLLEEVGILEIKKPKDDCFIIRKISSSLLKIDNRNPNGWYLETICHEQAGNLSSAKKAIDMAILFDPLNPVYLISRGVLEYNTGQIEDLSLTIDQIRRVNPDQYYLNELSSLLENSIQNRE